MQISFKSIKLNSFKLLIDLRKGAASDWKIILVSTLILSTLIIGAAVLMFVKIDKREVFVVENTSVKSEQNLNLAALLDETITYYQGKVLKFEKIKHDGIETIDPSL